MQAVTMEVGASNKQVYNMNFDSNSAKVGIDNRCSACMSHIIEDFEGPLTEYNRPIKGFGGTKTYNVKRGTIVWRWMDDQGRISKFVIPNSYYVPDGGVWLLSPQHWAMAQYIKGHKESRHGVLSQTTGENVTLFWNKRKSKLTVPLDIESNVASIYLALGYKKFVAFCILTAIRKL